MRKNQNRSSHYPGDVLDIKTIAAGERYDVLIIGGGPSGAAAAITLRRYTGLRVGVIEHAFFNDYRAGESVSPSIFPLLDYLGISREAVETPHLLSYGHAAAWGSQEMLNRDFMMTGRGNGLHLDRKKFDALLLAEAGRLGVTIFQPAEVCLLELKQDWELLVNNQKTEIRLSANYLIDCSGKNAVVAKNRRCAMYKEDSLIGLYAYYCLADEIVLQQQTLIETTEFGWYYLCPLPGRQVAIAFITDADILKKLKLNDPANWRTMGMKTQHITKVMDRLLAPVAFRHYAIHSRVTLLPDAEKWTAAGDAAACFDPVSALGIGHAINSGIHSARVAEASLNGDHLTGANYNKFVLEHFDTYLRMRKGFYSAEKRWPDSPFWQRRAVVYETAPDTKI
jgi:2-polyprenyl-6-methoxyphenol hydroxylase-like FAD-dependent oxidoreductase